MFIKENGHADTARIHIVRTVQDFREFGLKLYPPQMSMTSNFRRTSLMLCLQSRTTVHCNAVVLFLLFWSMTSAVVLLCVVNIHCSINKTIIIDHLNG